MNLTPLFLNIALYSAMIPLHALRAVFIGIFPHLRLLWDAGFHPEFTEKSSVVAPADLPAWASFLSLGAGIASLALAARPRLSIFRLLLVAVSLLLLPAAYRVRAQEIRAEVSRNPVAVGEVFRITYKANLQMEDFRMPRLSDFTLAGGPYQSFSQTFVNGRLSVSTSISYDLIPQKKGKYIIGAATARHEGRMITSNTLEIEVVEGSTQPQTARPGSQPPQSGTVQPADNRDIFIQAVPSKTSVYPGEPFTLTVKLYTRLQTELKDVSMPRLKGAFIQEIPDAADRQFRLEVHNGQRYYVAILRKLVVVAQKPGTLNLGKAGAEVKYQIVERTGDFWQDFFSGGRLRVFEKNLESAPIVIQVKPFPEANKPASFSGAVGNLLFKATLDTDKANTGDAIKLRMRVSGQGNIPLIDLPQVSLPPSFEVFEPQTTDKVNAADNGLSGSREQEIVLIPRSPGVFKITVPEFSWFDYQSGQYKSVPAQELMLHVEGTQLAGTPATSGGRSDKKEVTLLQDDIRYLKRNAWDARYTEEKELPWWPFILPYGAGIALFLLRPVVRRRQAATAHPSGKRAVRAAMHILKQAEEALEKQDYARVYDLCSRAFYQFLHDRFGLPLHAADRSDIRMVLQHRPEAAQAILDILNRCEAARFAPNAALPEADFVQRCRNLIMNLA